MSNIAQWDGEQWLAIQDDMIYIRGSFTDVGCTATAYGPTCNTATAGNMLLRKPARLPTVATKKLERVTCEYCGVRHDPERNKCSECGAPLPLLAEVYTEGTVQRWTTV